MLARAKVFELERAKEEIEEELQELAEKNIALRAEIVKAQRKAEFLEDWVKDQ